MDEKSIWIIPFSGKKEKWGMRSGKFMKISVVKVYDILQRGDAETLEDNADKTKDNRVTATPKLPNKKLYNKLILLQEDTIFPDH